MQLKNSITFQDVEDTSFFDNNIWTSETIYANLLGSIIIKVLGVKHSRKIILMRQIVGNCPTNHLIVGIQLSKTMCVITATRIGFYSRL